jgi:hypothetical protein
LALLIRNRQQRNSVPQSAQNTQRPSMWMTSFNRRNALTPVGARGQRRSGLRATVSVSVLAQALQA